MQNKMFSPHSEVQVTYLFSDEHRIRNFFLLFYYKRNLQSTYNFIL